MIDYEKIAAQSCLNCHTENIHSIVLNDKKHYMSRIFYAEKNHNLWKNKPELISFNTELESRQVTPYGSAQFILNNKIYWFPDELSVGLHDHHVNIKLTLIKGLVYNVSAEDKYVEGADEISGPDILNGYQFDSKLNGGSGTFSLASKKHLYLRNIRLEQLDTQDAIRMPREIQESYTYDGPKMYEERWHTVYVPRNSSAAWHISELGEYTKYSKVTYSNADLASFDSSNLYLPMTEDKLKSILDELKLDKKKLKELGMK